MPELKTLIATHAATREQRRLDRPTIDLLLGVAQAAEHPVATAKHTVLVRAEACTDSLGSFSASGYFETACDT